MKYTIYHNPRCSKSRLGLDVLQTKTSDFEIIDYLKIGISTDELKLLLAKLSKSAKEMIRTHEDLYKEKYKDKNFTEDEWIQIIVENPKLLHRPIVVRGNKAILANPIENLDEIIDK